jgi:hypothetical protein
MTDAILEMAKQAQLRAHQMQSESAGSGEAFSSWQLKQQMRQNMYMNSTERAPTVREKKCENANQQCQKCLEFGHWTYECKNQRVYLSRPSRTKLLKRPHLRKEPVPAFPPGETSTLPLFSNDAVQTKENGNKNEVPAEEEEEELQKGKRKKKRTVKRKRGAGASDDSESDKSSSDTESTSSSSTSTSSTYSSSLSDTSTDSSSSTSTSV